MPYEAYAGDPEDKAALGDYLYGVFHQARLARVNFEEQWEEYASLLCPEYRNSFSFGHQRAPGAKYTQYQVDSTGALAASRLASIADTLITPFNLVWSRISVDNPELARDRAVRLYLDAFTEAMWAERYKPEANFQEQQHTNWLQLAWFGNQYMMADAIDSTPGRSQPGLRYMSLGVGEGYQLTNHQNRVTGFIRNFRWTARQAYGRWGDAIGQRVRDALDKADVFTRFEFLQFILPRTDYDPNHLFSPRGKPWMSVYMMVNGREILEEGGYDSFPVAVGRWLIAPEEDYGRAPGPLPELKTKNAEKEAFLKQGLYAGDPVRLLPSDDLFDFKAVPGTNVYGGVNQDGRPLVHNLEAGNIQITKELMDDSDSIIKGCYLNDLFPMLFNKDNQQRSAREVIEVASQTAMFLAPKLGKQFTYVGDLMRREMVLLRRLGKLPPMPPVLREARGDFKFIYTSPLGRAMHSQEIAGYFRTFDLATQAAQATGDPSYYDAFDLNTALPDIAAMQHAPTRWMASDQMKAQRAKSRAAQQQQQQYVQSLPGLAAKAKADAISAKAAVGQNIGGTLSGTAPGGMPQMPATPQGMPGQPGVGGQPGAVGRPAMGA